MTRFLCILLLLYIPGELDARSHYLNSLPVTYSLLSDSSSCQLRNPVRTRFRLKCAILPASLITAGVIAESLPSNTVFSKKRIQQHVQDKMNGFRTSADNYLQFVPVAALFSLKLAGVKSRSDLLNQAILAAKSEVLMLAIVTTMKSVIKDLRPDGSTDNTMPSGHTAQAFVSAALLDMEYRETSPWISISGYLCATATGIFRITNNRHYASDVLIGAGIGLASVKIAYLTHRYRWSNSSVGILVPVVYQNGGGLSFAMKF